MKKFILFLVFAFASFILLTAQAEAKTAVTISVEGGPAYTEDNLTTIDLIVPERPEGAKSLQVGDKVFFEALQPLHQGEGTITDIYDTEDAEIEEAVILDHVTY